MNKTQATLLAILISGAGSLSAQTASDSASQMQQGKKPANQTMQQQGGAGGTSSSGGAESLDCPPELNQGAAERLDPPGPVGRTGGASAMVDDTGTIGSTGETRATSTSGATGTTGDVGSYTQDPSGSVTTAGSTGAPIDPLLECGPDAEASGASGGRGDAAISESNTQGPQTGQSQDKPTSHSDPRK